MHALLTRKTELDWLEASMSYLCFQVSSFLHSDFPTHSLVAFVWLTIIEAIAKIST